MDGGMLEEAVDCSAQISLPKNEHKMPKSSKKQTHRNLLPARILREVSNTPPAIRTKKTIELSRPPKLSFNPTFQKKFNDDGLNDESMLNQNFLYDNSTSHSVPIPVKTTSSYPMPILTEKVVSASSSSSSEIAKQTLFQLPFSGPSSSSSVPVFLFPHQNNSTSSPMIANDNDEQTRIEAENFNPDDAPLKLPTPFFSKESMIAAVSRGGLPSPAYLAPIVQKYHDLAAKYSDAEGNHPEYLEHHFGGENHLILLHFPVTGLDVMMKSNKDGTLYNATMNYMLYLLGPTFLNGLVCDVYPFKAPPDCKGKKWFEAAYGLDFVKECEAITLEFILAGSRQSSITKFVSMGKNPHRLMKIASSQFPSSHIVSTTCCHPHSAIQWGIDLDMARCLDQMATLLTGLPIRSQENHYNNHKDGFDAITAARLSSGFGGDRESIKQKNTRLWNVNPDNLLRIGFGSGKETVNQIQSRFGGTRMNLKQLGVQFGGENINQIQRDRRFGGSMESEKQKEGRKLGGRAVGLTKRRKVTPDMVPGICSGCGREGLTRRDKEGRWSRHSPKDMDRKTKHCGYYIPALLQ